MQSPEATDARVTWTWADLFGSYRFWGLFAVFVLAGSASELHFIFGFERFRALNMETIEPIESISRLIWAPLALVLAWIAIRTRPKVVLLVIGALGAAAFLTTLIPESPNAVGLVLESVLVPLLSGTMVILLPVLIGGACGKNTSILVALGLALTFDTLFESAAVSLSSSIAEHYSANAGVWTAFALTLTALILIIPIAGELFTVAPPERGRSFAPTHRDPVVTAILSGVVPFYILYWLYRIHGEEAHLKPSRKLLSPRAAAWICVVPVINELMIPFILSTLADHNNEMSASIGGGRVQRPWVAFLCGLLFVPVGVGLVQASLNKLAATTAPILAEPPGLASA
ncbi:MAG TPA: hypothetical protein VMT38_12770 [Terracidiphilus sp.]|nr:hypothetical protein [Terracidiphilus sp.]